MILSPFVFKLGFHTRKVGGKLWRRLVAVTVASLAIIAPYLPTWVSFLSQQWPIEHSQVRAGEGIFAGLLGPAFIPALFGLGEEFSRLTPSLQSLILSGGLASLFLFGATKPEILASYLGKRFAFSHRTRVCSRRVDEIRLRSL